MNIFDKILNLIFPKNCFGCGESGIYLCEKCKTERVKFVEHQVCFYCKGLSEMGKTCTNCKKGKYLDGTFVTFEYNSILRNMIHAFKYKFRTAIGEILGKIQNEALSGNILFEKDSQIIPVPIHKKRMLWRGFNQSKILSDTLAEFTKLEVYEGLIRIKNTKPQIELKREERLKNVRDAFGIKNEKIPESVILIDDVATTGATLEECAKILKKAGAKKVWALVLAGQF